MPAPLNPPCADEAPAGPVLTEYDLEHIVTYLRMMDAYHDAADWRKVSRIVLHFDPDKDHGRARRAYDSHLSRASWMTTTGYKLLLKYNG